jgi:Relaxase/Mobilisation nuclease domain
VIGKITSGSDFGGALEYQTKPKEPRQKEEREQYREKLKEPQHTPGEHAPPFEAGERHRIIWGNMSGQTKGELTREFEAIRRQRPDIEKPVHHASLSAGENDKITVEQWREIAARYIEEMGFKDAPYVVIQHRDGKDHIHILTSRVDVNGKVVSDWRCKERAEKVLRGIEKDYGLEQVKSSHEVDRAAPKRGELERFNRTGQLSAKMSLQSQIELALRDSPTATEFIDCLRLVGVDAIPYIQKDGRATGISFRKGKQLMKGSDLGRGFSWNALQERGLDYNQERDRPALEAARERADLSQEKALTPSAPERPLNDLTKELGRSASQYLLNQVNPIGHAEDQLRQLGKGIAEGYSIARDMLTRQSSAEQLQKAAGLDPAGRDAVERLQQAAGLGPGQDDHDLVERINKVAGLVRIGQLPDQTHTLDKTPELTPEIAPTLEHAAEERTMDLALELIL